MTSYEIIYERFLNRIRDFNLADLDDYTFEKMLLNWLKSAMVKVRTTQTITFDDDNECFKEDLPELDVELIAMGMTLAWLDQYINSTEWTSLFVGGKEEKFYSPSQQLTALHELRNSTLREMQQLYTYSTYIDSDYFDN